MLTLLNKPEIPDWVDIPTYMGNCDFKFLEQVETAYFRECLGNDFYQILKDDLTDVSGSVVWVQGVVNYPIGTIVSYKDHYYTATVATFTVPVTKAYWKLTPKFQTDCYNDLWCDYLGQLMSAVVLRRHFPTISTKVNGAGINKLEGDFTNATRDEVLNLTKFYNSVISETFNNMDLWMKSEKESGSECFDLYKGINKAVCGQCGYTKDQYFWEPGLYWKYYNSCTVRCGCGEKDRRRTSLRMA